MPDEFTHLLIWGGGGGGALGVNECKLKLVVLPEVFSNIENCIFFTSLTFQHFLYLKYSNDILVRRMSGQAYSWRERCSVEKNIL